MKKQSVLLLNMLIAAAALAGSNAASAVNQYATSVIDFSSQWSTADWSAAQALGAPDTFSYGDILTAWAPVSRDGTLEFLTLGFDAPVFATGATVRETDGNGFVYQVNAIDTLGAAHTVWSGVDSSAQGAPVNLALSWAQTSYAVKGLKVYVNTDLSSDWEEIDAVTLQGVAAVPEPTTYAMLFAGLGLIGFASRRRAKR